MEERTGGRAVWLLLPRLLLPAQYVEGQQCLNVGTGGGDRGDQVTNQLQTGNGARVTAGVAGAAPLPGEGGQGGRAGQNITQRWRTGKFTS